MIYLFFYFIKAIFLSLLPLGWFGLLFLLTRSIIDNTKLKPTLGYSVYVVVGLIPFAWVTAGYLAYTENCKNIQPFKQLGIPIKNDSIVMRVELGFEFGKQPNIQIQPILKELGGGGCIEYELNKAVTSRSGVEYRIRRYCGKDYYQRMNLISKYALSVTKTGDNMGMGYLLTYRIEDIQGIDSIAEAKESLFGRGLLKSYIGLLSGSNNPEYLACGYVGNSPKIWRNSRSSRSYETYKAADKKLISTAFGNNEKP